jgi:hypothetical protein
VISKSKGKNMKKTLLIIASIAFTMLSVAIAQNSAPSTDSLMVGEWNIQIGKKYSDTWTFKEGGVALTAKQPELTGTWKVEKNCILIQWDEVEDGCTTWEALTLPLKAEGTRGGNWNGLKVFAKKLK